LTFNLELRGRYYQISYLEQCLWKIFIHVAVIARDDCYDEEQRIFDYTDCDGVPGCHAITPVLRKRKPRSAFPIPDKSFDMSFSAKKPLAAKLYRAAGLVASASLRLTNTLTPRTQVPEIGDLVFLESVETLAKKIRTREVCFIPSFLCVFFFLSAPIFLYSWFVVI
jgi:hypothetical protein